MGRESTVAEMRAANPDPRSSATRTGAAEQAAASSALPDAARENPFVRYTLGMSPEEEAHERARFAAIDRARELYGDESSDAWLSALLDGTHPLCELPTRPKRA